MIKPLRTSVSSYDQINSLALVFANYKKNISRLSMIIRVNIILNRTVVFDSD